MKLETAWQIVNATDEMSGVEIALLTIIRDLQTRLTVAELMIDGDRKEAA